VLLRHKAERTAILANPLPPEVTTVSWPSLCSSGKRERGEGALTNWKRTPIAKVPHGQVHCRAADREKAGNDEKRHCFIFF